MEVNFSIAGNSTHSKSPSIPLFSKGESVCDRKAGWFVARNFLGVGRAIHLEAIAFRVKYLNRIESAAQHDFFVELPGPFF